MKLVVLGASGGCGKEVVKQAVARGHAVTAVLRPGAKFDAPAGVEVLKGQLDDAAFLGAAFAGRDAVLSCLGLRLPGLAPWAKPEVPDFLSRSTPAIVAAMKAQGLKRVVAVSAGGVGDSADKVPGAFRAFIAMTALRHGYRELDRMESIYAQSGLEVCLPRPTGLTDGPLSGKAGVVPRVEGRATISRADVAAWMLDAVAAEKLPERAPMITTVG